MTRHDVLASGVFVKASTCSTNSINTSFHDLAAYVATYGSLLDVDSVH
jgi:hypothetical protein